MLRVTRRVGSSIGYTSGLVRNIQNKPKACKDPSNQKLTDMFEETTIGVAALFLVRDFGGIINIKNRNTKEAHTSHRLTYWKASPPIIHKATTKRNKTHRARCMHA